MTNFEGEQSFALPPDVVAARLGDAAFLLSCLQNVDEVVEAGPDKAAWKLRTGFSFLSTTLEVTLTVTERSAGRASYEALSRGVGASSRVEAVLTFQPSGSGTTVRYSAEIVERTGFLKVVSGGLIQAAAKAVIDDTWKAIDAKLSAGA
jgi:carbon monoxide dehydrogenase subunit G